MAQMIKPFIADSTLAIKNDYMLTKSSPLIFSLKDTNFAMAGGLDETLCVCCVSECFCQQHTLFIFLGSYLSFAEGIASLA